MKEKIIYGCYPSFLSLYFVNIAIIKYKIDIDTIIISTRPIYVKGKKIANVKNSLWFILNFGLKYTFYQILLSLIIPFYLIKTRKIDSFKSISRKYNVQIIYSSNFNSDQIINVIKKKKATTFISFGLDQILQHQFLKLFKNPINIHPSKLPKFKGPDPIFNFLLSDEKIIGVTLHRLIEEIDSGDLLISDVILKKEYDTHFSLLKKCVSKGCELLSIYLENKEFIKPTKQGFFNHSYYTWPNKVDLNTFVKKNKYFHIKDLHNVKIINN